MFLYINNRRALTSSHQMHVKTGHFQLGVFERLIFSNTRARDANAALARAGRPWPGILGIPERKSQPSKACAQRAAYC